MFGTLRKTINYFIPVPCCTWLIHINSDDSIEVCLCQCECNLEILTASEMKTSGFEIECPFD